MFGEAGDDRLDGRGGRDEIRGGDGDDTLDGGAEDNRLHGEAGDDLLRAAGGYDVMDGGTGDDTLIGGGWADEMAGGPGADRFLFLAAEDSAGRNRDVILDLSRAEGDRIDLSAIDADAPQPGNQAFTFIGEQGAPGRGELGSSYVGLVLRNFLRGNTDDDPEPEFEILVDGRAPLVAGDVIF